MSDTLERLRIALRDKYAVARRIGEGGMATVFLAEDVKHHRQVAIKVLRPELSATLGAERFLREIEMAAQLQHPHIVPVYDSGAADGFLYYVMPFIEGESLRDLLQREGRLGIDRAAEIVRDAASGLAYAHKHGVVHRDVKPENIMLSGGHAVVADFGIARAIDASRAESASMTGVGMAIGTPAYMSPEQATADNVDARSDQYALACVFYEMASGKQPFSAPTMQALLTQVLTAPRPRLSSAVQHTPPGLAAAVQRALAQDPAQRFPDIMTFASTVLAESSGTAAATRESKRWKVLALVLPMAVGAVAVIAVIVTRPHRIVVSGAETIAVVPFRTTGTAVEGFGEGMVDLLGANLDGVGGIRTVESRQVLRAWQRQTRSGTPSLDDAIDVAKAVHAASVLTGSLLATGPTARMTAELYDLSGKQLARAQLDGPADSVLALTDRLALQLLREIWRSKEPLPSARSSAITSTSMEAIRAYLEGEKWYRKGEWDSAQASYEHAVHADSTFAIAWYKLASTLGWEGQVASAESSLAGQNAVKYSTNLPARTRTILVAYEMFQRGRPEAVDSMRQYTQLHPEDADGWYLLGEAQYHTRNYRPIPPAEQVAPFDRVLALDSTLTAAAIHPVEVAITERDTFLLKKYLHVFQAANADVEAGGASESLAILRGADTGYSSLLTASTGGMRIAALTAVATSPGATGSRVDSMMRQAVSQMSPELKSQGLIMEGVLEGALGRQRAARAIYDSARVLPGLADQANLILLIPALAGFADSALSARYGVKLDSVAANTAASVVPYINYYRALLAYDHGDRARVATLVHQALAVPGIPDWLRGSMIGLDGLRLAGTADSARVVAVADSGLRIAGGFGNPAQIAPIALRFALYLAAHPATRADGISRLRYGFTDRIELQPIIQYNLAKIYDAGRERSNAVAAYGQFLRLWDRADSTYATRIHDARDALQRLTAEGSKP
jgi:tRNA A-37 threonylcarbamoyl transferase component Bud32/tetratricopeptide (TPR) repeat protein